MPNKAPILTLFLIAICLSCQKNKTAATSAPNLPVLNTQEQKLIGTWIQDSVRIKSVPSYLYTSGLRFIFYNAYKCDYCSNSTYKGNQETTPGSFTDFAWTAKKQDTLMIGTYSSLMSPEKIDQLTSSKLVLSYKGSMGDSCVAYFHK